MNIDGAAIAFIAGSLAIVGAVATPLVSISKKIGSTETTLEFIRDQLKEIKKNMTFDITNVYNRVDSVERRVDKLEGRRRE